MTASGEPGSARSPAVVLLLAAVAAISAVAVCVLARNMGGPIGGTGDWIALFLPVIVIDALVTVVGVLRAIGDLRRARRDGRAVWQPISALALFAISAAAVSYALWLFASRSGGSGFSI